VFDAEGAAVLLLDRERDELYFPHVDEADPEVAERLLGVRFPAAKGLAGAALEAGAALRIDDVTRDPRFYAEVDRHSGRVTRNALVAPLVSRQGPVGVLEVVNRREGAAFSDADRDLLSTLASSVAVAIENAQLWAHLKGSAARLEAQVGALRRDQGRRDNFGDMVGSAPSMREVFHLMESAAAAPITVLLEGETGTGKELVARGIHQASARG